MHPFLSLGVRVAFVMALGSVATLPATSRIHASGFCEFAYSNCTDWHNQHGACQNYNVEEECVPGMECPTSGSSIAHECLVFVEDELEGQGEEGCAFHWFEDHCCEADTPVFCEESGSECDSNEHEVACDWKSPS